MNDIQRRKQLRDWIAKELEETGEAGVDLPALSRRAVEHFMANKSFVHGLMQEALPSQVYNIAKSVLQHTRPSDQFIVLGDEIVTGGEFHKRSEVLGSRFRKWMEHAGDRHYRFMEMNAAQLLAAAAERERRGTREFVIAALERRLAKELGPKRVVSDLYSDGEVESIYEEIKQGLAKQTSEEVA